MDRTDSRGLDQTNIPLMIMEFVCFPPPAASTNTWLVMDISIINITTINITADMSAPNRYKAGIT
ncbi:hypothetical protein E2C01_039247 [Portunus trituberculatus]|uniref:Uncharacterized protein n=1 Tax=Portunus trituberculatus TaxID=210409 RepID=A0A5B7FJ62_PORTR|nr:hypothetical protein [Portunus trituberculatus]